LSTWRAKDILPETEVYDGVVCFLSNERLVIKQMGNNKRINVHLSNVGFADDPSFILGQSQFSVGCFVTFAAFFNEKNQPTISRLTVVASQNVNNAIPTREATSQDIRRLDFIDFSADQGTKCMLPTKDENSLDSTPFSAFPINQVSVCSMLASSIVPLASDFQQSGQWPASVSPSSCVQSITPPSAISSSDDANSTSRSPHCWMVNSTTNENNWVGVFGSYSPTLNAANTIAHGCCTDAAVAVVGQKSQSGAQLQFNQM
uniref:Uncharacterized protein n=1 Tax=Romanomermis culicivorax TaxID=13658 RepID=A0A915K201_ROMCU